MDRLKLVLLSLVLPCSVSLAQFSYTIVDLGTLGGTGSAGNAINNSGQVAGTSYLPDDQIEDAFVSGANGALPLRDLGNLGGAASYGQAISSSGRVAGIAELSGDAYHAYLTSTTTGMPVDLGTLGGMHSYAYAVNASGQVAGSSLTANNAYTHAFLSGISGGALADLGTLPGGTNSYAFGVNSKGQAVGYSDTGSGNNHAFISDANGGALHDLGTLGGGYSFASVVNDSGQVVGRSEVAIGEHAFVSDANGGSLHDLGTLGGYSSFGEGVNSAGSVTGYSYLSDNSTQHGFLYKSSTGLVDVNTLLASNPGWVITDAKGINDSGQMTGAGIIGGQMHAYLMNPILPVVKVTSITKAPNSYALVRAVGVPSKIHSVYAAASLSTSFKLLGTIAAAADGTIQFQDTGTAGLPLRFYRLTYP